MLADRLMVGHTGVSVIGVAWGSILEAWGLVGLFGALWLLAALLWSEWRNGSL